MRRPTDWSSRVSEGERGRSENREGTGTGHAGPCGPLGGLGLLPQGRREPWRAVNSWETRPDLGDNRHPLMATSERRDCGGTRVGAGGPGWRGQHWSRWAMMEPDQGRSHGGSQK